MRNVVLAAISGAAWFVATPAFAHNACDRPEFVAAVIKSINQIPQYTRAGLEVLDINNIVEIDVSEDKVVCHADFTTNDGVISSGRFILHLNHTSDTGYIEVQPDKSTLR